MAHEISRDTRKLTRIPTLIIKKNTELQYFTLFKTTIPFEFFLYYLNELNNIWAHNGSKESSRKPKEFIGAM